MEVLDEMSFKIVSEEGIARFKIIPKDPNIKKVLFFNPYCPACKDKLKILQGQKFYAVDINETPLLGSHFNIKYVPIELSFS